MTRIEKYILSHFIKNAVLGLCILCFLFLMFEFFDRVDNILQEDVGVWLTLQYFIYRVPLTAAMMLPVSIMTGVLLTLGVLSKNSEVTAMRATGMPVVLLLKPLIIAGLIASVVSLGLNETIVPYSQRRAREIYNIDIKQKDKSGAYSQSNIWWRESNTFYSVDSFDSRTQSLANLSTLSLTEDFEVTKRSDAKSVTFVTPSLGWTMHDVDEYHFADAQDVQKKFFPTLPLPISYQPSDFFDVKTDPHTMSFLELRRFIQQQNKNGLDIAGYMAFLHEKLSFPLINFIVVLLVAPFAIKSARSGGMASSIVAAMLVGFSYYAVHSFSLALGRAELVPPMLSAWLANVVMTTIGVVLVAGAEAPQ